MREKFEKLADRLQQAQTMACHVVTRLAAPAACRFRQALAHSDDAPTRLRVIRDQYRLLEPLESQFQVRVWSFKRDISDFRVISRTLLDLANRIANIGMKSILLTGYVPDPFCPRLRTHNQ